MTDDELDKAFLELVESGEFDRILRQLRNAWERVPRETVLEVLQDAVTEVVQRHREGQTFTNLAGLITTIARRKLIKVWEAVQGAQDAQSALEVQATYPEVWQHDEERVAKVKRAADYVRTLVPRVDNENYRRTIYAILDAAEQGKQLMPKDLAENVGCSPNTASKWMERAPERLLPILKDAGFDTVDDLLGMPPPPDDYDQTDDDNEEISDD